MKLQFKNIKLYTSCLLSILIILYSTIVHSEENDIQTLKEKLENAYKEKTLISFGNEIDSLLKQSPSSPGIWYVKGLWYKFMARQRYHDNGKVNDDSVMFLIQKKNEAIEKAMELDLTNEPHLTANQYYWVAHGLPIDLKLEAYRRVLSFEHFGEYPKMRDNVYGRMLSALYDAGRYEEAIELMHQMTADPKWLDIWENSENEVLAIKEKARRFEQKIKERDLSKDASQETKPAQSKPKIPAVQTKPDQTPKPSTPKIESTPENVDDRIWYIVLGVLVIIVIGITLLRRRGKK